jgi:hypothetical protein
MQSAECRPARQARGGLRSAECRHGGGSQMKSEEWRIPDRAGVSTRAPGGRDEEKTGKREDERTRCFRLRAEAMAGRMALQIAELKSQRSNQGTKR